MNTNVEVFYEYGLEITGTIRKWDSGIFYKIELILLQRIPE